MGVLLATIEREICFIRMFSPVINCARCGLWWKCSSSKNLFKLLHIFPLLVLAIFNFIAGAKCEWNANRNFFTSMDLVFFRNLPKVIDIQHKMKKRSERALAVIKLSSFTRVAADRSRQSSFKWKEKCDELQLTAKIHLLRFAGVNEALSINWWSLRNSDSADKSDKAKKPLFSVNIFGFLAKYLNGELEFDCYANKESTLFRISFLSFFSGEKMVIISRNYRLLVGWNLNLRNFFSHMATVIHEAAVLNPHQQVSQSGLISCWFWQMTSSGGAVECNWFANEKVWCNGRNVMLIKWVNLLRFWRS